MTLRELLIGLRDAGVTIDVDPRRQVVRWRGPHGAMTPDLRAAVGVHRRDLALLAALVALGAEIDESINFRSEHDG